MQPRKYTDEFLKGKKYGGLTYVRPSHKIGKVYHDYWKCDCGNEITAVSREVVLGRKKSCSCNMFRKKENHAGWTGCGELTGSHWGSILGNAKNRNIEINLTINEAWEKFLKQKRKCALTGVELTLDKAGKRYGRTASLDRIKSNLPYTKDNIQWIHKNVNYIKRDLDEDTFIELCHSISRFNA